MQSVVSSYIRQMSRIDHGSIYTLDFRVDGGYLAFASNTSVTVH